MARKYTPRRKIEKPTNIIDMVKEYTQNTEYPIVKEFCYQNNVDYDWLMREERKDEELKKCIKQLVSKKESFLEYNGIMGKLNPTMCVFTLKQLGWSDNKKVELDTTNVVDNITPILDMLKSDDNGNK